jgi:uncharacterized lipoprotein YddW (UPF0748 family)
MNLNRCISLSSVVAFFLCAEFVHGAGYISADVASPPPPQREFRGAWIATVGNIDWPSKPGLPVQQQKAELLAMLDIAQKLNLNAIVLQVRPACDAIYESRYEPWSAYLTGTMGVPPAPFYDPLEFAVEEAHKRGLELHAWFNPFRAGLLGSKSPFAPNHISRTHPKLVHHYGKYLWLEPGDKEVQNYCAKVIMDVVNRYDIDGVHFDDYFYPYKETDAQGRELDFPDAATWHRYQKSGGKLSRGDWRRQNVNLFVQRIYDSVKAAKPWVKVGIAPFGIWQPGYPPQIKGFNAYDVLYCDSRKWLMAGWLDYCSPQLYWPIDSQGQSFPALLKWWTQQNPLRRNLWPGIDSEKVGSKRKDAPGILTKDEFINEIKLTRTVCGNEAGVIHWNMRALLQDRDGLATALRNTVYAEPALVPPSSWLDWRFPDKPRLRVDAEGRIRWETAHLEKVSAWVLQTKKDGQWTTSIFPGRARSLPLTLWPDAICIREIDRCGVASPAASLVRDTSDQLAPAARNQH